MLRYLGLLVTLLLCVVAAPAPLVRFDERSELPRVTFADATYQATSYEASKDVRIQEYRSDGS